ncbi:MAG: hypothetical protein SFY69_05780 [Planctomycetota bacterium]|nr:hypothetical protein [Planctomycetota bacterium]
MKCACSTGLASTAAVVLGLGALGFGGYNLATTGCVLGNCSTDAAVTAVAAPAESGCALCDDHGDSVSTVANTAAHGSCSADKAASCGDHEKAGCDSEKSGCDSHEGEMQDTVDATVAEAPAKQPA